LINIQLANPITLANRASTHPNASKYKRRVMVLSAARATLVPFLVPSLRTRRIIAITHSITGRLSPIAEVGSPIKDRARLRWRYGPRLRQIPLQSQCSHAIY
jgi:hypothetical protein